MIQAYHFNNGPMKNIDVTDLKKHFTETVWLDLFNPTIEEETFIEGLLDINIPTRDEMQKFLVNRNWKNSLKKA